LLSNGANCTVLRAVVLTQYRRVTDGRTDRRTDGIAVANTALAMRAYCARCKKNQRILMQFSLIDLEMNGTCDSMNFTHLTQLMLLHYFVKVKTPKM